MGKNKKKQNISKKEKQIQQYQKHQCATDEDFSSSNQQGAQDDVFSNLAEQIKNVDPDAPLPDFSDFEKNQQLIKNIMEDINQTVKLIGENKLEGFEEQKNENQEQQKQKSQLSREMKQKRDQYVKSVKGEIRVQQKKQNDLIQLSQKENMKDIKEILENIASNIKFDVEKNEELCKILNEQ